MSKTQQPPVVYKVIGAPGTGKTTRVVGNPELPDVESLVMENMKDYPMEDQMIVTYTKAGVEEAQERLDRILDVPQYVINDRVLTIHAYCYRTLGVEQDQVVRWWHEREFCSDHDLRYGNSSDDGDIMSDDHDEGHALFQIYEWCKNNRRPLDQWHTCPAEYPGQDDPLELMRAWENFKEQKNLIQFCDMIEMVVDRGKELLHENGLPNIFKDNPESAMETFEACRDHDRFKPEEWRGKGPFPDTLVLYVDEVQDLYPLQWEWYLMSKLVCDKVYIGGDDDQTIYGWAGANPDFMLDEEGDFEVLDKTYRIPKNIWEVCDGVIRQVDKRQEKDVEPHGDGGEVHTYRYPRKRQIMDHLKDDECFALFRANYMVDEFREALHEFGIPYRNMSTYDTWSDDVVLLRDALATLKAGEERMDPDEVEIMIEYGVREHRPCDGNGCQGCNWEGEESLLADDNGWDQKESAFGNFGGVKMERVRDIFDLGHQYADINLTWRNYLAQSSEINYYEKEAIKGNLENGNEDMEPDRLRIGTIHSSKGKEAETVMIALDSTQRILENMREDVREHPDKRISDAERRVYYVGMTRASEELVIAQGVVDREYCIRLEDLLADGDGENGEWASAEAAYEDTW